MNYTIRHYKKEDYKDIASWWNANNKAIAEDFMSEETSFILEMDSKPLLSLTVYLTNCPGICYLENFIGNPEFKGKERKEASKQLVNFAYEFAKAAGYKHIMGFSTANKLDEYYQELGMKPLVKNITSMVRSL